MSMPGVGLSPGAFRLKEPVGWFAAGERFRGALTKLSDGGFKMFAWLCLRADRRTGCFRATQVELATALGKSRRSIVKYVAELQDKGVCDVYPGKNQHSQTTFEIRDEFWPYHRCRDSGDSPQHDDYVAEVRERFLSLGCTEQKFSSADEKAALAWKERGVPLHVVRDALLMGACRKYVSWLNGAPQQLILSLKYFEMLISEVQATKIPEGYTGYLEMKVQKWSSQWRDSTKPPNSRDEKPA